MRRKGCRVTISKRALSKAVNPKIANHEVIHKKMNARGISYELYVTGQCNFSCATLQNLYIFISMNNPNRIRLYTILSVFIPVILSAQAEYNGLRAVLSADSSAVHMGACMEFRLEVAFDSMKADKKTRILNRYSGAWTCELSFVNEQTGELYTRVSYDAGMLAVPMPGNLAYLSDDSLFIEKMTVYLLSDEGEQIPPGTYQARAHYENNGGDGVEAYIDSAANQNRQRPYPGPWSLWKGSIESAPFRLEVLPAGPAYVELPVPSTIRFKEVQSRGQVGWTWSDQSPDTVRVWNRPGYALGHRWKLRIQLNGEEIDYQPHGEGGSRWPMDGMSYFHRDISSRIRDGEELVVTADLEIFESSVPPRHFWMPESGDFKILWSNQITGRYP